MRLLSAYSMVRKQIQNFMRGYSERPSIENGSREIEMPNKAFQLDKVAVSHLLQKAQKLRHSNFAPEQRR